MAYKGKVGNIDIQIDSATKALITALQLAGVDNRPGIPVAVDFLRSARRHIDDAIATAKQINQ